MKNSFIIIFLLNLFCFCSPTLGSATAESPTYYRIETENVTLFKTETLINDFENVYFNLPKSYFVKYISSVNENVIKVEYDGVVGYANKNLLTKCYGTPQTPYANIKMDAQDVCNLVIYSAPTNTSNYVGLIPFNAENVKCFGSVSGNEAMEGFGNEWLYVKYQSFEQGNLQGFVYAPLCKNITAPETNTEEISTTPPEEIVQTSSVPVSTEFKNPDSMLLIIGLSVLAIIILCLLFKPEKRKKINKTERNYSPTKKLSYIEKHTEKDEFDF